MKNILLICKKELKSYFASPIAYLLMAFFGLIFGATFYSATKEMVNFGFRAQMMGQQQPMNVNEMIIRPLLGFASTITLFLLPMITMMYAPAYAPYFACRDLRIFAIGYDLHLRDSIAREVMKREKKIILQ